VALKIDLALAEYREKYLNINDIKELIGNFQGVLEDAFEKGYQAAQQEINEAEKTPTNTTKVQICPCCEGTGKVDSGKNEFEYEACLTCNGTGKL